MDDNRADTLLSIISIPPARVVRITTGWEIRIPENLSGTRTSSLAAIVRDGDESK